MVQSTWRDLQFVGSFSVNGVAKLHSDILAERELKDFAQLYPSKFNNRLMGLHIVAG